MNTNMINTNHDFFSKIDNEIKAYFVGFILADGCILDKRKNGQKKLAIGLHNQDIYVLERFKKELNSSRKISEFNNGKGNYCCFSVSSNKLCDDLIKLDITPRKSLTAKFDINNIPIHLRNHFIRGLFDGDGSISYCPYKNNTIKSEIMILGTFSICNMVKNIFDSLITDRAVKRKIKQRKNIYCIRYAQKETIKKIYDYLYQDATFYLHRKKEKFNEIFKLDKEIRDKKSSKFRGVCWQFNTTKNVWLALSYNKQIKKSIYVGNFDSEFKAYLALCDYEKINKIPFSNDTKEYLNQN